LHGFDRPPGLLMRIVAVITGLPFVAVFVVFGAPLFFLDLGAGGRGWRAWSRGGWGGRAAGSTRCHRCW
jgi:hypothetical protein